MQQSCPPRKAARPAKLPAPACRPYIHDYESQGFQAGQHTHVRVNWQMIILTRGHNHESAGSLSLAKRNNDVRSKITLQNP
jgi:hypothetical protein